jgi:glycosyltransferase involved in cell wall biosynthesis
VRDRGLCGAVELPGPVRDVGAELAKASIFVLSSRHEGFSLTMLEAMSKGLAVISFDSPHGPREAITQGHDGLLVSPRTPAELAAAIIKVIEDERLRRTLARNGRRTAQAYDMTVVGARWDALLDELVIDKPACFTM